MCPVMIWTLLKSRTNKNKKMGGRRQEEDEGYEQHLKEKERGVMEGRIYCTISENISCWILLLGSYQIFPL